MADEIDKANELADLHLQAALDAAKVTGNERLTGACHWCDEPTRGAFCSPECRTDHGNFHRMHGK